MAKYQYPAIFHFDKEYGYWVEFPDWEKVKIGATTDGKNYAQARYMAEDLLGMICYYQELDKEEMPPAGKPEDYFEIGHLPGNFIEMINADTEEYAKVMARVKKGRWRWRLLERARKRYLYPYIHMAAVES